MFVHAAVVGQDLAGRLPDDVSQETSAVVAQITRIGQALA